MIVAPHCCCDNVFTTEFESKEIIFRAPFRGFTYIKPDGSFYQGWTRIKYMRMRDDYAGILGTSGHIQVDYDSNNGNVTTVDTTGSVLGQGGALTINYISETHVQFIWANGLVVDRNLSIPIDVVDKINQWRLVFDGMVDLLELNQNIELTHRAYSPFAAGPNETVILTWPSLVGSDPGKASHIEISPTHPLFSDWDGTYTFTNKSTPVEGPAEVWRLANSGLYGCNFANDATSSNVQTPSLTYDSGGDFFYYADNNSILLIKSACSFPDGIGCDLSAASPTGVAELDYSLGDMIIGSCDINTGVISDSSTLLELAPGVYGFDGNQIHVFSGAIINFTGSFPQYGWCKPRHTKNALPPFRSDFNYYSNNCPP